MSFWEKHNLFDITKSVFLVVCAVFIIVKGGAFLDRSGSNLTETQYTRIAENVMRAQVVENDKAFKEMMKEFKAEDSELLKNTDKKINELGKIVGRLDSSIAEMKEGDLTVIESPDDPKKEVIIIPLDRESADGEKIPVGNMYYNPNMDKVEDRFTHYAMPLEFHVGILMTEKEDGSYDRMVELNVESPYIKKYKGKKFKMKVTGFKWAKKEINDKKFRFHTRLGFGANFTTDSFAPALDVSFFSYGRTEVDMDWRFLVFSLAGDEKEVSIGVYPVQYNVGKILPLVENIFIGPTIMADTSGEVNYGVGISVPF
jgi:hypothetical protein